MPGEIAFEHDDSNKSDNEIGIAAPRE